MVGAQEETRTAEEMLKAEKQPVETLAEPPMEVPSETPAWIEQLAEAIALRVVDLLNEEDSEETTVTTTTKTRGKYQDWSDERVAEVMKIYDRGGYEAVDRFAAVKKHSKGAYRAVVSRVLKKRADDKTLRELTGEPPQGEDTLGEQPS